MNLFTRYYLSPLGCLQLTAENEAVIGVEFVSTPAPNVGDSPVLELCQRQLEAYFAGTLTEFTIPLSVSGTDFQIRVWHELQRIPFGSTLSYGGLAQRIGNPKASRAVGGANNRNPIAIIIPCHRVIGVRGELTGYAGGLDRKEALLEHEKRIVAQLLSK